MCILREQRILLMGIPLVPREAFRQEFLSWADGTSMYLHLCQSGHASRLQEEALSKMPT